MSTADIEDIYELSPLQQGMLFHVLYEPESRLYFEQILLPFEGFVNQAAFEGAWNRVAANNSALRTSFHWKETEKPVQVVHSRVSVPIETQDLRNNIGDREAQIESLLDLDRQRAFDIQRAPLLRVTLIRLSSASYRLLFSFHHLILDGWSLQHVFREFSQTYEALCLNKSPIDSAVNRPYSDYIRWLQRQDLDAARRYWREALSGVDRNCRLNFDAELQTGVEAYSEYEIELPEAPTRRLREYGARHALTMNTLAQGAWALLVHRLNGNDDVVFGITVSGRPAELQGVESMVGLFINTVPLRVRIDHNSEIVRWLRALQIQQFAAREFDYSPLVQIREWAEVSEPGPLFDSLLAFENYPVQGAALGTGAAATFVERTNYPLSAAVVPGESVKTRLLYNKALTEEAVVAIAEQFNLILEALSSADHLKIGALETMTATERHQFDGLNSTKTAYPADKTVTELWREHVRAFPNNTAVEFGNRKLTYSELDRAATKLGSALGAIGVEKEMPVGVVLKRSIGLVVAVLGILKAGGAYVPIDPAHPPARMDAIAADIGFRFVISSTDTAPEWDGGAAKKLFIEDLIAGISNDTDPDLAGANDPDCAAYVMYTSGSSGAPKGITIPHRAIVRLVRNTNYIEIQSSDRIGHMSNCAFDAATFEIWGALLNGATIVGFEQEAVLSPVDLGREIRERRLSVLFITTALFNQLAAEAPDSFRSLRVLLFGGEAVDPGSVRSVLMSGAPGKLLHVYGPTETTTFATWHPVEHVGLQAKNIPIGRPISNTTAYVLNQSLRPLSLGATGELCIGGPGLARGYHGRADMTAERFVPDPFCGEAGARMYRTGDKVRWRRDGAIEFLGRFDNQVKVRGYRIELGEIERRLQEHDQVRASVVAVRKDSTGDNLLIAYVVPKQEPADGLSQELRNLLRKYLPEYMQPAAICSIPAVPLNRNGKIDYHALPAPDLIRTDLGEAFVAPRNEIERRLAGIWQQVLGLDRIGIYDVFFDIGGHSLRATQLVSRMRREFDAEIELRSVFENPTIAGLAGLLQDSPESETTPIPVIGRVARDDRRRLQE
jgi:amino acid adenylation domain-containing protein